jgi:hypothetical protein
VVDASVVMWVPRDLGYGAERAADRVDENDRRRPPEPSGDRPILTSMPSPTKGMWWSVIDVGGLPLSVVAPVGAPSVWPAGSPARISGCIEASREGPPAAGRTVLAPAPGYERAYHTMAAALAADDMIGLLGVEGAAEHRLRSLGEALVAEWGRAATAEEARGFTEAELAGALLVLRSLPRRLPPRHAPADAPAAGTGGAVVDLMQVRRARGQ